MERLSNKPLSLMMLSLLVLGVISLIWLFTQILWQPVSRSPSESVLVDQKMATPTAVLQQESAQTIDIDQESITSAQAEQVESADTEIDDNSADTSAHAQAETVSLRLGEWRELDLEGTIFAAGFFVGKNAENDTLIGHIATGWPDDLSDTVESAIIAINLDSGTIQTIADFGPLSISEAGYPTRLASAQLVDNQVFWVENILPARFTGKPKRFDVTREFHIYDLHDSIEKTVTILTYLTNIRYRDNIFIWYGTLFDDEVGGIYTYHMGQEEPSMLQEYSAEHRPVFPKLCNQEWAIYLESVLEKKHVYTLYLQHLTTKEKIELAIVSPRAIALYQNLHQCDPRHVVWIARDATGDELAIYNLESRQQRSVQIPELSSIAEIHMSDNMIYTAIDPHNSIGYHLVYDTFLHVPNPWEKPTPERFFRPVDFVTEQYWVQVHSFSDYTTKIIVAPIEKVSSVAD